MTRNHYIRKMCKIKGDLSRHEIVKKVVNRFIAIEHKKKGKGVIFRYYVEDLPKGKLFIVRPGHKKNFDFKVDLDGILGLGRGSHSEIALYLRRKKIESQNGYRDLFDAITKLYKCEESDVDEAVREYPLLAAAFQDGAIVKIFLKVVKWLFIMEDIIYWDSEGRAFLYNFLRYVAEETDEENLVRINEIKDPEKLKKEMRRININWLPYE